jgi:hypothetical protein
MTDLKPKSVWFSVAALVLGCVSLFGMCAIGASNAFPN